MTHRIAIEATFIGNDMTTVDFSFSDAVQAIRSFHCLPEGSIIKIDGLTGQGSNGSGVFSSLHDRLVKEGNFHLPSGQRTKIPAIKLLRQTTDLGLKDSKKIVDDMDGVIRKGLSFDLKGSLEDVGVDENKIARCCNDNQIIL